MSVAAGPYKKLVPFINTEDIRLSPLRADADRLKVSVQVSNEIGRLSKKIIKFGNFVYLTHNRHEAMALCTDIEMLTKAISTSRLKHAQMFGLSADDFKKKPISMGPRGSRQYVHRYTHTVDLETENQNELYLVVASFREYKNRISIGNVMRETLLTRGKVPASSTIYRLEESIPGYGLKGVIWPGSVHRRGKDIMAGNIHVRTKHPKVSARRIPNIKVKDMRIVQLAYSRQPQYDAVETNMPFVSPLEVSRNALGIINGMFSFDMLRFIEVNSSLSGIMTNNTSLLNSVELKDITIWKKKSRQDFKGNSLTPVSKASCGINEIEGFKKVASLGNGCEVLDTDNNGNEILDISYVDDTNKGVASGFIEYRVEVLMADRSKLTIANMVDQLTRFIVRIQNDLATPQPSITTTSATQRRKAYYAAEGMINLYLDALHYLFGAQVFEPYTRSYWQSNLIALAYNVQNDVTQKHTVLRIVELFVKNLNKLIQKPGSSTVAAVNHRSRITAQKRDTTLAFRHRFDKKMEIQGDANVGLGYVDDVIQNLDTVTPHITFKDYSGRVSQEVEKYNIADPQATNVNKYGFLSPSFMGLGSTKTVDTRDLQMSVDSFLPLARSRMSLSPVQDNKPHNDDALNKLEILQSQGVSIIPLKVPLKREVIAPLIVNAQIISAGDLLGRNSKFYIDNLKANAVSGSQRSIVRRTARKGLTKSPLVARMINKAITNFKPQKQVKNGSLLQGSIALTKTTEDPTIVDESDSMTAITNYGSMVQVQYLAPYKKGSGIKKQNWKILDKYTFEKAQRENTALVCRTTKVSNTVDGNSRVELQPLSSLFTLGEAKVKNTRTIPTAAIPRSRRSATIVSAIKGLGEEILYSKNISLPAPASRLPGARRSRGASADPDATAPIKGSTSMNEGDNKKMKSRSHRRRRSRGNLGY